MMTPDEQSRMNDMEECLAGFVLICSLNGVNLSNEMKQWACVLLKDKPRTCGAIWNELFLTPPSK